MSLNLESIGRNIRERRLAMHLHQDELAERTGLSSKYIGMIERDEKAPSLDSFVRIANALNTSTDILLVDVLCTGYSIKDSLLAEQLEHLSPKDRSFVCDIANRIIRHCK